MKVRITLEMTSEFARLLFANTTLAGLADKQRLDPAQQLAFLVQLEARGAEEAQTREAVHPEWRGLLSTVPSERRAVEGSFPEETVPPSPTFTERDREEG